MSEQSGSGSMQGGGSNRDARASRPKVQQLRPTNKSTAAGPSNGSTSIPSANINAGNAGQQESTPQAPQRGTSTGANGVQRAVPRIITGQGSGSNILINSRQRQNPIVALIKNVPWEYGDIVPDFQVGLTSCVLFLSIRYHRLHPEYIHQRIEKLGKMYTLRILMISCDVDQPDSAIKELTKLALIKDLTVMVGWSNEELARYLELYKKYENKSPDLIRERINDDFLSHYSAALRNIRGVNKTDVHTLATHVGAFSGIANVSSEQLDRCPGFGEIKIANIIDAFHQPFRAGQLKSYRERRMERELEAAKDDALEQLDRIPQPSLSETNVRRPNIPSLDDEEEDDITPPPINKNNFPDPDRIRQNNNQTDSDLEDDIEDFDDMLEGLTEEERLQLALEMSISGGGGGEN
jgi:DNA excision repair protein ERCC-1